MPFLTMIGHWYYGNPFSIIVSQGIIELIRELLTICYNLVSEPGYAFQPNSNMNIHQQLLSST